MPLNVAVLSFSTIARDGRVMRTAEALRLQGHEVTVIGFGPPPPIDCDYVRLPWVDNPVHQRFEIVATQFPSNLVPSFSEWLHFGARAHRAARAALLRLKPQLVHANDWRALPSAATLRAETGASIIYDSHEFATEEHADNRAWRIVARRHTQAVEARFIKCASIVTTVSDGIADSLQHLYGLPQRPLVIRNTPYLQSIEPAQPSAPLRLLFHGILKPGRGIEETIEAMRFLEDHHLTLRGNGSSAYLRHISALASSIGLGRKISFEPAVSPKEVVRAASSSHIGIFCAPIDTRHNVFAMPNKAFEYLMGGLAVLATKGTELASFVKQHDCGLSARACNSTAIAEAVACLNPMRLSQLRASAIRLSFELSWERERKKLIEVINGQIDSI